MKKMLQKSVAILVVLLICLVPIPQTIIAESSGDYQYTISENSATVEKYTGPGGDVAIPGSLGGYPVTSIGDGAFWGTTGIKSLAIPDSVVTIGEYAFSFCTMLTAFAIPQNVASIGKGAFFGCDSLATINVAPENTSFSSNGGVLFNYLQTALICYPKGKPDQAYTIPDTVITVGAGSFSGCSGLTSLSLSANVTTIEESAFSNCTALTRMTLTDQVKTVGDCAFWDCASLTAVTISKEVASIGGQAFVLCQNLKTIDVASENRNFVSIGGVLFDKKISSLLCYPAGQTAPVFNIPESVSIIGENAFNSCRYLTDMTIPDSVITVNWRSFKDCTGLKAVSLGKNLARIGMQAFAGCTGLTSIEFPASIYHIGEHAFSGCQLKAAYIYGDAPAIGYEAFHGSAEDFKIYYILEKNGFAPPTLYGYRTDSFSPVYSVTFDAQNDRDLTEVSVAGGNLIPEPDMPNLEGHLFVGWYQDPNYLKAWNFETDLLESDITLYARWMDEAIEEPSAKSVDSNSVVLSWLDDPGCDYYEISRDTSLAGSFEIIDKINAVGASYNDLGVKTGITYFYKIRGYSICGMTAIHNGFSEIVSATPIPARPENFIVSRISPSIVQAIWSPVDSADGYEIYRATSRKGSFAKIADNATTNYLDESLIPDLEYFYKVRSYRQDDTTIIFGEFTDVLTP